MQLFVSEKEQSNIQVAQDIVYTSANQAEVKYFTCHWKGRKLNNTKYSHQK